MARRQRRRHRPGRARLHRVPARRTARSTSPTLSSNFGIAALNEYGDYPRTWNLEQGARDPARAAAAACRSSGAWFKGSFHNLTTTINQSWSLADYTPYTFYNPLTGEPFTVFARSARRIAAPTRNLDTFDPDRKQQYEAVQRRVQVAPAAAAARSSAAAASSASASSPAPRPTTRTTCRRRRRFRRTRRTNGQAFCDDFALDIPWRKGFKLSGTTPVVWGIDLSVAFQSNESPDQHAHDDRTRGITRYPANCPSPCPAGQIIMPTAVFGQTSLIMYLEPARATSSNGSRSSTSRSRARSASAGCQRAADRSRCSTSTTPTRSSAT